MGAVVVWMVHSSSVVEKEIIERRPARPLEKFEEIIPRRSNKNKELSSSRSSLARNSFFFGLQDSPYSTPAAMYIKPQI